MTVIEVFLHSLTHLPLQFALVSEILESHDISDEILPPNSFRPLALVCLSPSTSYLSIPEASDGSASPNDFMHGTRSMRELSWGR